MLTLTYLGLAWGKFAGSDGITHLGGYLGLLTAVAAFTRRSPASRRSPSESQIAPVGPRE